MKIKILAKKSGLGNAVQFIPMIKYLIGLGHDVYSDHEIYGVLGICPVSSRACRNKIAVYGYDVFKLFPYMFWGRLYGFRYNIRGFSLSVGLRRSVAFKQGAAEAYNNRELIKAVFGRKVEWEPVHETLRKINKHKIVLAFSSKKEKHIPYDFQMYVYHYFRSIRKFTDVAFVDHDPENPMVVYKQTPTLESLVDFMKDAYLCIAVDTGVAHLADYLGVKTVKLFGPTDMAKNRGNAMIYSRHLHCSPCYWNGRYKCTRMDPFECNNFAPDRFIQYLNRELKHYLERVAPLSTRTVKP